MNYKISKQVFNMLTITTDKAVIYLFDVECYYSYILVSKNHFQIVITVGAVIFSMMSYERIISDDFIHHITSFGTTKIKRGNFLRQ